ncbi:MAG: FAD-dependent oxidoreductase [Coriobacteriales bacterium]|nr:FAD-dependent oxidoreductase [Coriobacteriales bacterium]
MSYKNENLYDAIIIGAGPAGMTAALYLARARYRVLVIEKERIGGQIAITAEVVNYPGILTISGAELMQTMRKQALAFGAEFINAKALALTLDGSIKEVQTDSGTFHAFGVLLATGARPRKLGFKGEDEFQGHGVAYCATCDGEFFTGMDVFVIGGGYAAAEEAIFLTAYARKVIVVMRGADFSCAKSIADAVKQHANIDIHYHTVIEEVSGDTVLRSARFRNIKTDEVWEYAPNMTSSDACDATNGFDGDDVCDATNGIDGDDVCSVSGNLASDDVCSALGSANIESSKPLNDSAVTTFGVFVFAGYTPATELLEGLVNLNEQGYVVVDANHKTSVDGIYAAGDVCAKRLRQVVTATADGAIAAGELEHYAQTQRDLLGIVPKFTEKPTAAALDSAAKASDKAADDKFFSTEIRSQLDTIFSRMESSLELRLSLDERQVSKELKAFADELASLTNKLFVSVDFAAKDASAEQLQDLPVLRIFKDDSDTGFAFHGVPGGHEFNSFALGMYNISGPGQKLDDDLRQRIAAICEPITIRVLVSLSCTMCPDAVVAAGHIAALNPLVRTEIYDIAHFSALREQYQVMSVPCIVVLRQNLTACAGAVIDTEGANTNESISFGRRDISQLLDLLEAQA